MLNQKKEFIRLTAGDNLLHELGNNNLEFDENLNEFIDNTIQTAINAGLNSVKIDIFIGYSGKNPSKNYLKVIDNSCGMDLETLQNALSPGKISENVGGLHEHGMGLNTAISGIGILDYITTKTKICDYALKCDAYKVNVELPVDRVSWEHDSVSGTEICIKNVKPNMSWSRREDYSLVKKKLAYKYRYFISNDFETKVDDYRPQILPLDDAYLEIRIIMHDIDKDKTHTEIVEPLWPAYAHPETKENKPWVEKKIFEGKSWKACLVIGYAPFKTDIDKQGKRLEYKHPTGLRAGLDVIIHKKILMSKVTKEIGIDLQKEGNSWMKPIGELHLLEGFKTTSVKNCVQKDENFHELVECLGKYLKETEFFKLAPKSRNEEEVCDKLIRVIKQCYDDSLKNIEKGYKPGDVGFPRDLTLFYEDGKKEIWEVKTEEASAIDVLQPFGYMLSNEEYGKSAVLVAKKFQQSAYLIQEKLKNLGYYIKFKNLGDLLIEENNG